MHFDARHFVDPERPVEASPGIVLARPLQLDRGFGTDRLDDLRRLDQVIGSGIRPPAELRELIATETEKWKGLVRISGAQAE